MNALAKQQHELAKNLPDGKLFYLLLFCSRMA